MTPTKPSAIHFAGLTLDLAKGRLTGPQGDVALRPKSFAVLSHLAEHAGRVVSKDELMAAVWPNLTVSDDSLTQCIKDARKSLGLAGSVHLRTLPRRGYLFDLSAPCSLNATAAKPSEPDPAANPAYPAAGNGSIAVLPFAFAPAIPPQVRLWFDGAVHDLIGQLARLRSFDVIARGSAFALRDMAQDPVRAGQVLGVAYALSGSVDMQRSTFTLRVDLVSVVSGTILWTDEIALDETGVPELVDAMTDRILGSILSRISIAERNRARLVADHSLTAWQAYHRGLDAFATYSKSTLMQARAYFTRAIDLDPGFVRAFAGLSECQATLARAPFCADQQAEAAASLRMAETAMRLDEASPDAQFAYAHSRWLNGDPEIAGIHARKSVALSPSFAQGFAEIGFYASMYNDPDEALRSLARVEVLNPINPFIDSHQIDRAVAHLQMHDLEGAALWASKALNKPESYGQMQITGAIILAAAGQLPKARSMVRALGDAGAVFDPRKIFRPPFSLAGPAKHLLERAVTDLDL